jgi:outer membrane protein
VRAARNNFAVSQLEVRKQRGAYLPLVTLDVFYQEQKSSFPSDSYGAATLNFTLPIWDSGATASKVRAATEGENQARLAVESTELRVRDEIRRALLDVETAETSLALANEQAAAAQAEYDQTFDLYQAQEATALDVRQAETSLADAKRAIVESSLDRDLARAGVWYFVGSLADVVLGTPVPEAAP